MPRILLISLLGLLAGCKTTQRFHGTYDEVFDAATAAVPYASGGMRLTASDSGTGRFEGLLVDGFGNVYLSGRVRPQAEAREAVTVVEVDCWEWSLKTLWLFPVNAGWAERQFVEALAERLADQTSGAASTTRAVGAVERRRNGTG